MSWSVAEARARLSQVIQEATREPQVLDNRGRPVAVVVGVEAWEAFERWRRTNPARTMAAAVAEIQTLCDDAGYDLELAPREARANAFAEALDGVDR
jgi:prevent-host-death family protein